MSMSKRPPNVGGLLLVCDYIEKAKQVAKQSKLSVSKER